MAIESAPECRLATFELHPRPPYRLDLTVWALRRRARNEIDLWDGSYRRALLIDDGVVGIRVVQVGDPERPVLVVEVLGSGACTTAELVDVETQARRLLGVDVDLDEFYSLADADPRTRALKDRFLGLRPLDSPVCSKRWRTLWRTSSSPSRSD